MWKLKLARYYIVGIALAGIIIPLIGGSISNEIAVMVNLMVVMLSVFLVTFPIVGIIYITSNKKQQSLSLIYFGISLAWIFLSFVAYKLYTTPIM
ncbi:MAG: hypothetical protein ACO1PI_02175 [Bacteroidota bacterium]